MSLLLKYCPLLTHPRILAFKNSFLKGAGGKSTGHVYMTIFLSVLLMLMVFIAASSSFHSLKQVKEFEHQHLVALITFSLIGFFSLATLSSLTSAISVLFTGPELDRLFSAPIKPLKLYIGKLGDLVLSSGLMLIVLGIPLLLAFIVTYDIKLIDLPAIAFVIALLFLLAFSLAYSTAILCIRFIPLVFLKGIVAIGMLLLIAAVFFATNQIGSTSDSQLRANTLVRLSELQALNWVNFTPPAWTAEIISSLVVKDYSQVSLPMWYLGLTSTALFILGFLCTKHLYQKTYSGLTESIFKLSIDSKKGHRRWLIIFWFLPQQLRALLGKELRTFSRDFSQLPQLAILIGLCLIYILNFKTVEVSFINYPYLQKLLQPLLLSINLAMGGFITCAIATRFIYPSISLEGRSFWITAVAPISQKKYLHCKFWIWYWPTALITCTILTSGALALQAEPLVILITFFSALLIAFGVVGLAIGIGASFVNLNWENQTQLTASMGSLVFVACAISLVSASTCAMALPIFLFQLKQLEMDISIAAVLWVTFSCFSLLAYINYLAVSYCMRQGVKALQEVVV